MTELYELQEQIRYQKKWLNTLYRELKYALIAGSKKAINDIIAIINKEEKEIQELRSKLRNRKINLNID